MNTDRPASDFVRIWDPFVRLFHWTVVIAFFVAYFTEDDVLTLHVWAGYTIGVLVVLRIVWGFVGPRHARFFDFIYGPGTVWRYLTGLLAFKAKRYLGHSPAGGAMVVAVLVGLLATVWSGMEVLAVEKGQGPLAQRVPAAVEATSPADAGLVRVNGDDRANRRPRREHNVWEDIHEVLANLMLVLVLLHIAGVALASVVHRENLVRAMVTGSKRRAERPDAAVTPGASGARTRPGAPPSG